MNKAEIKKLTQAEKIRNAKHDIMMYEIKIKDRYNVWGML